MPVKIPADLPGRLTLEAERVPVIPEDVALRQDVRPLRIVILNLMPDKIRTETQLLRLLGATPLQLEITLLHAGTHESKNTSQDHLTAFYQTHDEINDQKFDGLIVTGAPIEHLPYEDVTYWKELTRIFDWAERNVYSSFFICWGAQAAMFHYHGAPKYALAAKQSGVYPHKLLEPFEPLINGFDDVFGVPVSRNTEVRRPDIEKIPGLDILIESDMTGVCLVNEPAKRRAFMFNHLEYDAETLRREYVRDSAINPATPVPYGYFPHDDPALEPRMTWRAHRALLFSNWINMIYQGTPFDLSTL